MGDKKSIPAFIEKRLQERLVDRGEVTAEGLQQYLDALPDLASKTDYVDLGDGVPTPVEGEEGA